MRVSKLFLPQRDGLELSNIVEEYISEGLTGEQAIAASSYDIYGFDLQALYHSDAIVALVALVAGTEPDSGTVVEVAPAANAFNIAVVLYLAGEIRLFSEGVRLNPLLSETSTLRRKNRHISRNRSSYNNTYNY